MSRKSLSKKGRLINLTFNEYVPSTGNTVTDDQVSEQVLNDSYQKYAVDLGSLPEVVITPDKESNATLSHLREMFKTKDSRHGIPNSFITKNTIGSLRNQNISDNEVIDRLYNIYKMSGKPEITSHRSPANYLGIGLDRANYSPITNTMFVPTTSFNDRMYAIDKRKKELLKTDNKLYGHTFINTNHVIPELSHAFQYNSKYAKDYSKIGLFSDIKINGKSGYEREGHYEHDAHSIIEPNIYDYIHGNIDLNTFIDNIKNKRISLETL